MSDYKVLSAFTPAAGDNRQFALDVLVGLSERPKRLSSKYFYDDRGSELFRQIMALEEYYPTDCEREILETHGAEIVAPFLNGPFNLVDLGAGDGAKTRILLEHLLKQDADVRYVPIDISEGAIKEMSTRFGAELPDLAMSGVVSDYMTGIEWLGTELPERKNLVLFLGSNVGNFDKANARAFLRQLWSVLRHDDGLLIGFDLKKDIELLLAAYNDKEGVTAEFNINVLRRINRELGGNFDLDKWRHYGTYDVFSGAMKSYLVALETQTVRIDALEYEFEFAAWEPIHMEYSYKYLEEDVAGLAASTGFLDTQRFYDGRSYFVDALWQVNKG